MAPTEEQHEYPPVQINLGNRIHRVNGYDRKNSYMYYPVVIAGAGFAGIAMAHQLRQKLGFSDFRVFERQSGIGGTWWINRYPGVACDVPAIFYSFSFAPNPRWTSLYPSGAEIYNYLQDTCDKHGLTDKIQLNTDVRICRWLRDEELWEVQLALLKPGMGDLSAKERARLVRDNGESSVWIGTETIKCKILISGVGGIVEPKAVPDDISGFDKFQGKVFHSNRWDDEVDFTNKDVVVLGTGCSSAQLVPRLIKAPHNAKSVTQLMRSPPWVLPKEIAPPGFETWAPYLFTYVPGAQKAFRYWIAARSEWDWRIFPEYEWSKKARKAMMDKELKRMKSIVPEKYHELMTPDYEVGCKRKIFDAEWLESFNDPRIKLTTMPLTEVHERSVTLGPGQLYPKHSKSGGEKKEVPADVIVLANGFDMTRWLAPLEVRGTEGQDLVDTMQERGGPQAYLGAAVDGFPNFFIIYGPNTTTGHSSVILAIENMVQLVSQFVKPILRGDMQTVEVKKEAETKWALTIQRELKKTVFHTGGCSSWYFDKTGWNSTVLPYNQIWFWFHCTFPTWRDWNIKYTRKGLVKLALARLTKAAPLFFLLLGWYRAKKEGMSLREYTTETYEQAFSIGKLAAYAAIVQSRKKLKKAQDYIMAL